MIQTYKTILTEKKEIAPEVVYFRFKLPEGQKLEFKAGQYMILFVPQEGTHDARRLYSIVSSDSEHDYFDLLIKYAPHGLASEYLRAKQVGDEILFQGPAGVFTLRNDQKPIIFLATGTGIAPMRSMLYHLIENKIVESQPVYLFWGLAQYKDAYFVEEFAQLQQKYPNIHPHICISRENDVTIAPEHMKSCLILGRINAGFEDKLTPELLQKADFYICGSKEMVEATRKYVLDKGVPPTQVFFEKFV